MDFVVLSLPRPASAAGELPRQAAPSLASAPRTPCRPRRCAVVARVFTPKDFGINDIMAEIVTVIREAHDLDSDPD